MKIIDHNGTGEWSRARIQERYEHYCVQLACPHVPLMTKEYIEGETKWISPLMDQVIERIEQGDSAGIALGIDIIDENQFMPFGSIIKSNTARALRRAVLAPAQKARLRKRLVSMLTAGIIPHEFREYAKLLRTIGVAEYWAELHVGIPRENPFAMRFYDALVQNDPSGEELRASESAKLTPP